MLGFTSSQKNLNKQLPYFFSLSAPIVLRMDNIIQWVTLNQEIKR